MFFYIDRSIFAHEFVYTELNKKHMNLVIESLNEFREIFSYHYSNIYIYWNLKAISHILFKELINSLTNPIQSEKFTSSDARAFALFHLSANNLCPDRAVIAARRQSLEIWRDRSE